MIASQVWNLSTTDGKAIPRIRKNRLFRRMALPSVVKLLPFLCVLPGFELSAHDVEYYDLASLYYLADVVAEVKELGYETERLMLFGQVEVLKSYKGDAKKGQVLNVSLRRYKGYRPEAENGGGSKVMMFLLKGGIKETWLVLSTGMKLIEKERVRTYKLNHVPKLSVIVEQKSEFVQEEEEQQYGAIEYEEDFQAAIRRVKDFQQARAKKDIDWMVEYLISGRLKTQWDTDEIAFEAAKIVVESEKPEIVFNLLFQNENFAKKTLYVLRNGFGCSERIQFLWEKIDASSTDDKTKALAFDLIALNQSAGYFSDLPEQKRAESKRKLQGRIIQRALDFLSDPKTLTESVGAAKVIYAWHPERTDTNPIVPVNDSAMIAIQQAIEGQKGPLTRYQLIKTFCRLGGKDAYRQIFNDEIYFVGAPPAGLDAETIEVFVLHPDRWRIINKTPVLTVKALTGPHKGKLFIATSAKQKDAEWQMLRDMGGEFLKQIVFGKKFEEPLPTGEYELRVRGEYLLGEKLLHWWSVTREVKVTDTKQTPLFRGAVPGW